MFRNHDFLRPGASEVFFWVIKEANLIATPELRDAGAHGSDRACAFPSGNERKSGLYFRDFASQELRIPDSDADARDTNQHLPVPWPGTRQINEPRLLFRTL